MKYKAIALCILTLSIVFISACERKGPMEKVGEAIDNAAEEIKDAASHKGPLEKVGESVDNAVKKVTE